MDVIRFDLNDIKNEPSDEALASLMEAVADEVRRRQQLARKNLVAKLKKEMEESRARNVAA